MVPSTRNPRASSGYTRRRSSPGSSPRPWRPSSGAPARLVVLDPLGLVPDVLATIARVSQHRPDGCHAPGPASALGGAWTRWRHPLSIQVIGEPLAAPAAHIPLEDPPDDPGLFIIGDPAVAVWNRAPAMIHAPGQDGLGAVAVGQPTSREATLDATTQAPVRIVAKLHKVLLPSTPMTFVPTLNRSSHVAASYAVRL